MNTGYDSDIADTEAAPDLSGSKVLIVDDNTTNLKVLLELLEPAGYTILVAESGAAALRIADQASPDVVLLDVMMPGMDGYEVCRRLRSAETTAQTPIIFITANDQMEGLVAGFEAGGVDYITKPIRGQEVLARLQTHLRLAWTTAELRRRNEELRQEIAERKALTGQLYAISEREAAYWGLESFVAESPTMQRILDQVADVQDDPSLTILIAGETGCGKELVARSIHHSSPRRDGAFVSVRCSDLPQQVVDSLENRTQALSLLFGHASGAFAGAAEEREGFLETAHGGTLYLDEIASVPPPLQGHLLRVLQEGALRRLGEHTRRHIDIRVLAATSCDLGQMIQSGQLGRDFHAYLSKLSVSVPPLRQRPADIELLARHFHHLVCVETGREGEVLSSEVVARLRDHAFPGNVRELKNIIERAFLRSGGAAIEPGHLDFGDPGTT